MESCRKSGGREQPLAKMYFFFNSVSGYNKICQYIYQRFPLYYLTVVVGLREARTLLERFRSKSYDFNTQFKHVS